MEIDKVLSQLSSQELKEFKEMIENLQERDQLLQNISGKITRREEKSKMIQEFRSGRLPYFDREKKKVVDQTMKKVKLIPFISLFSNSLTSGNNKIHDLSIRRYYSTGKLEDMEAFFTKTENRENYEGLYNTFQYIKNYIYYCAQDKEEVTEKDIFKDEQEKRGIVTANLVNIATYLEEIREGTKLRLSVGNASLTVSTREKTVPLTKRQEDLVEALAFGMPLEKLQKGNYEDAKRLLYLPRQIKKNQVK